MTERHSPLDAAHRRLGAKMVAFGGWTMPLAYPAGTIAEHLACRRDAVVFDVSHLGTVRVGGPQAFDRLQRTLTNDLGRIAPGRAQYTHLLEEDGSVADDIIVWWVDEDRFDVMPNASNTARVVEAIGGDDVTGGRAVLAVQGPASRAKLAAVSPEAASVARFHVRPFEWRGAACLAAGTGYTGEDGVEIAVPAASAAALWEVVLEAGIPPAGLGARDTLRLEAGLPLHGHELGPGITPLQANLGWVVAWDKPSGFRGRDALVAERAGGVARRLGGLAVKDRRPPRQGYSVLLGGRASGTVTSGNFSPTLGHGIALAFLPPDTAAGTGVEVEGRGHREPASVVPLPFVGKRTGPGRAGAARTAPPVESPPAASASAGSPAPSPGAAC
jgi:aminomethyltransferase